MLQEGATFLRLGGGGLARQDVPMQNDAMQPPENSLIAPYHGAEGHYVDCFACAAPDAATLPAFIVAFYTQPLFQAERLVLRLAARSPSTDAEAKALADGARDTFAVWRVAGRSDWDILLADASGRTLSWLGVGDGQLWFGSVVVPVRDRRGRLTLGPVFQTLLGVHKVYSRALLAGAVRRI